MIKIRSYVTPEDRIIMTEWLHNLEDARTRARIVARLNRLSAVNFGDSKAVGDGVHELRIDCGPGYRVYYAIKGQLCVVLLCAGDKRRQSSDIEKAVGYWNDYKRRSL